MDSCIVYRPEELLPDTWRGFTAQGPVRLFNPGLLRDGDGWLLAYRVVGPDQRRRIGLCRLNAELRPVAGSTVPLSDRIRFDERSLTRPLEASTWFADPRLYRFAGRLFVYWNSGWHEPQNYQFLQELDGRTFEPLAGPRELRLRGERRKLEKNWMLFQAQDGALRAVYSILPHRLLELSLEGQGDVECHDLATTDWTLSNYPASHGGLRGGAPPQLHKGLYWSFCHSVHDATDGYEYRAAVYAFDAHSPFAPLRGPVTTLELPNPFGAERIYGRLNPAVGRVVYPCGATRHGNGWLLSYGINDEHAAVAHVSDEAVDRTLGAPP